ncbi:MAG: Gfo/Idh/MocA family oxidoreductase [Planctomycetaceae bacterium]|nr:Gfo/Idh/MocA family oxidoreductase [Planctomycetaceae bacterium]
MSPSSQFNRRSFLAGSLAVVPAATLLTSPSLGFANHFAANEKINIGMIGVGKMAYGSHLPHLIKMPEVKVVAVCDVDKTRREAAQKRVNDTYGNTDCDLYNDYQEILAREDIDAVVIATPDHWHSLVVIHAAQAGKDIYCEKPLTNNLMEAKLVMDIVKKTGVIFQTGSQQRASDNFRHACELVRNGHIGDIKQVTVGVGGPSKSDNLPDEEMEPGLDWERWLGPAPMRKYSSILSPRGVHNHFPAW